MWIVTITAILFGCDQTEFSPQSPHRPPGQQPQGNGGGQNGGGQDGGGQDGGGQDDGKETETDPSTEDRDGDGLSTAEEEIYGTDPDVADSDQDGFLDGEEVNTHGTNPAYAHSHPYAGGYNVGWCSAVPTGAVGSGRYQRGDVVSNVALLDQHGESVDLYSFCGQYVLIAFGAGWCGPCQDLAAEAQDVQDRYADDGFQFIEVLIENVWGGSPSTNDLSAWADYGGMETIPVLADGSQQVWSRFEQDGYIPTTVLLGPDMAILSLDQGLEDPGGHIR